MLFIPTESSCILAAIERSAADGQSTEEFDFNEFGELKGRLKISNNQFHMQLQHPMIEYDNLYARLQRVYNQLPSKDFKHSKDIVKFSCSLEDAGTTLTIHSHTLM